MKQVTVTTTVKRVPSVTPTLPQVPRWQQLVDQQIDLFDYRIRTCAPCPAVIPMLERSQALDRQWQYFIRAANYGMTPSQVAAKLHYMLALANGTGFGDKNDPRKNYLTNENLDTEALPQFDKVRTFCLSILTGTPGYSLKVGLKQTLSVARDVFGGRRSFMALRQSFTSLTALNVLIVKTFDGSKLPPLKPGKSYPQRIQDVNIDDYLFTPEKNREMFMVCNNINARGEIVQWSNGAIYPWTKDGMPYVFMPYVSRFEVRHPLAYLVRLPDEVPTPSPYRFL